MGGAGIEHSEDRIAAVILGLGGHAQFDAKAAEGGVVPVLRRGFGSVRPVPDHIPQPVDGALSGAGGSSSYLWGIGLALLNSVGYAALTLIANRARGLSPLALAWWQCAVGAVVLVWWPFVHGWPPAGPAWAWLAGLGAIHTGLAYVVLYAGVARLTAGRVAVLQFVYPACAVGVEWAVYGRALTPSQLAGVLMMLTALVVVGTQRARQTA